MGMAVEALSLVSAPSQAAASAIGSVAEVKSKLQGCVASLVALDTVWEVGKATYVPELAGYADTDLSSLETVSVSDCRVHSLCFLDETDLCSGSFF